MAILFKNFAYSIHYSVFGIPAAFGPAAGRQANDEPKLWEHRASYQDENLRIRMYFPQLFVVVSSLVSVIKA